MVKFCFFLVIFGQGQQRAKFFILSIFGQRYQWRKFCFFFVIFGQGCQRWKFCFFLVIFGQGHQWWNFCLVLVIFGQAYQPWKFLFSWTFLAKVIFIGHFGYEYHWWKLCLRFEILSNLWHPALPYASSLSLEAISGTPLCKQELRSGRQLLSWDCKYEYTRTPVGKLWHESTSISYPGMERVKTWLRSHRCDSDTEIRTACQKYTVKPEDPVWKFLQANARFIRIIWCSLSFCSVPTPFFTTTNPTLGFFWLHVHGAIPCVLSIPTEPSPKGLE